MKVVFIIGPYRASTPRGIVENIRAAEAMAIEVWKSGAVALCAHKNSALFDGILPDEVWLAGALELLTRCDAAICVGDWHLSEGSRGEATYCADQRLPIFNNIDDLKAWLDVQP